MSNKEQTNLCNLSCKINKKLFYGLIAGIIILFLIFIIPKYFTGNIIASEISISSDIEKLEIIHFHGTHQCSSCIAVGDLAEKTVNTYFSEELKSGKIIFNHLNAEFPENYELTKKYGVRSASLWIGTYHVDGTFDAEENVNVWYKINKESDYMNYLKGVIEDKLVKK